MRYSLGIDAAWTIEEPSGLALLSFETPEFCEIVRAGRSYNEFVAGKINWSYKAIGSEPKLDVIVDVCSQINAKPTCIAIDMPISNYSIIKRRSCENHISSHYGGKGASTHSPTPERPGQISNTYFRELVSMGYEWKTNGSTAHENSFIEVFPHTAIIEYLKLNYRYEYKISKKNKYSGWKALTAEQRQKKLIDNLNYLVAFLSKRVENIHDYLPVLDSNKEYSANYLKGFEDLTDSVICALVGVDYLDGAVNAFGEDDGTIWVPNDKNI
jgi:predicted RNase H-like nuclease